VLLSTIGLGYSKDGMNFYASRSLPDVVGLEMASWRYFGVQSHQLSWAQSATLQFT
jgi:penicillin-binding protein 1C